MSKRRKWWYHEILIGLGNGYPLCCVLRYAFDRRSHIYSAQRRGRRRARYDDARWDLATQQVIWIPGSHVPCGIFHKADD